jgi:hypothetical protein
VARRTRVEEAADVIFLPTIETTVNDIARYLGDEIRLDMTWKIFDLHGSNKPPSWETHEIRSTKSEIRDVFKA